MILTWANLTTALGYEHLSLSIQCECVEHVFTFDGKKYVHNNTKWAQPLKHCTSIFCADGQAAPKFYPTLEALIGQSFTTDVFTSAVIGAIMQRQAQKLWAYCERSKYKIALEQGQDFREEYFALINTYNDQLPTIIATCIGKA